MISSAARWLKTSAAVTSRRRRRCRPDAAGRGVLLAKSPIVVAGMDVARAVFAAVAGADASCSPRWWPTATAWRPGPSWPTSEGPPRALLTAERIALNLLQRLSGIATATRRFVEAAAGRITILDTRKTTPSLRELEKYAVRMGGGTQPSLRAVRRYPDQGQPHPPGRRDCAGCCKGARGLAGPAG